MCTSSETGELASGKELEDICKQICLADSQCKAFETAHDDISTYYATQGASINCCIEREAPADFQNPLNGARATGYCQKEAKCWNTHVLTGSCPILGSGCCKVS